MRLIALLVVIAVVVAAIAAAKWLIQRNRQRGLRDRLDAIARAAGIPRSRLHLHAENDRQISFNGTAPIALVGDGTSSRLLETGEAGSQYAVTEKVSGSYAIVVEHESGWLNPIAIHAWPNCDTAQLESVLRTYPRQVDS